MNGPTTADRRRGRRSLATLLALTVAGAVTAVLIPSASAAIVAPVPLGTTRAYSVLAGTTVTNIGPSVLNGSLGVWPGDAVVGFPPGIVNAPATIQAGTPAAATAQADLTVAYNNAAGRPLNATVSSDLAGATLVGGVYAAPDRGPLGLTGTVTLDGANNPSSVFIFQTDSTLITGTSSRVELINGAQECNVFWQVGSSATVAVGSTFRGNILALTSVTVQTGATVHGRALARNAAVTLDTNVFRHPTCDLTSPTTGGGASSSSSTTPGTPTTVGGTPTTVGGTPTTVGGTPTTVGGPSATTTIVPSYPRSVAGVSWTSTLMLEAAGPAGGQAGATTTGGAGTSRSGQAAAGRGAATASGRSTTGRSAGTATALADTGDGRVEDEGTMAAGLVLAGLLLLGAGRALRRSEIG